jgi:proteasome accessory factor B
MGPPTPSPITKTQRWLDLITTLLLRKVPLTADEIYDLVPHYRQNQKKTAVQRMFERDKDELGRLGIRIEKVKYSINHGTEELDAYRLKREDFYLPYLDVLRAEGAPTGAPVQGASVRSISLPEEDADSAIDALLLLRESPDFPFQREAGTALGKLQFDLDPARYSAPPVLWVDRPGADRVRAYLRVLTPAMLARKVVKFRYNGIDRGVATDREVECYGLFLRRDWYLVGHDRTRDAMRVFRVSRMDSPVVNTKKPKEEDYEVPGDFRIGDYTSRRPWELVEGDAIAAEVRVRFPAAHWLERNGEGEPIRREEGGAQVFRFDVTEENSFLRWVLSFAGEADVVSPPELRAAFRSLAADVARTYGGSDA